MKLVKTIVAAAVITLPVEYLIVTKVANPLNKIVNDCLDEKITPANIRRINENIACGIGLGVELMLSYKTLEGVIKVLTK